MQAINYLLFLVLTTVAAVPKKQQRIVGGIETTIENYPFASPLLYSGNLVSYRQSCGGSIINNRAILTAAHCVVGDSPVNWIIRVGSTFAHSGGTLHNTNQIISHQNFNWNTADNDIAILRSATPFSFSNAVGAASIAGTNYNLGDNQVVWAAGWGDMWYGGPSAEQLRHVQVWTVNQNICRDRYSELRMTITDNMLCSGWLDVGGRDQCQGDSGGPLIHNGVVVGVCSFGEQCALARWPGVSTRVSRYTAWIQSNA